MQDRANAQPLLGSFQEAIRVLGKASSGGFDLQPYASAHSSDELLRIAEDQFGLENQFLKWRAIGLAHFRARRFSDAELLLRAASSSDDPHDLPFKAVWADALFELGRFQDALNVYGALALPSDPTGLIQYKLGLTLGSLGRHDEALAALSKARERAPGNATYLYAQGNAFKALGQTTEARRTYTDALQLSPTFVDVLNNRGSVCLAMGEFAAALADFDRAVEADRAHVFAHLNRGIALARLNRFVESASAFERAIALEPNIADAHYNLGIAHHAAGDHEKAIGSFQAALVISPRHSQSHLSLGNSLQALGRYDEALAAYRTALDRDPDFVEARINMATVLQELARHSEALEILDVQDDHRPDFKYEVQWNTANSLLYSGPTEAAWSAYEGRLYVGSAVKASAHPLLGKNPVDGKRVLVQWEQRFGDVMQMLRYVPLLEARASKCYWQVATPLRDLVQASFPQIEVVRTDATDVAVDYRVPYTSLPLALRTFEFDDIPNDFPYLHASDRSEQYWQTHLTDRRPRIGICWRGNAKPPGRSVPIDLLGTTLLQAPGVSFVSLQTDQSENETAILEKYGVKSFSGAIRTFDDTAGIVANLDLVVSIDTAACHLVGGMAKPLWVLLKVGADWRWHADAHSTAWYPTAKLFRQEVPGEWQFPLRRLSEQLALAFT